MVELFELFRKYFLIFLKWLNLFNYFQNIFDIFKMDRKMELFWKIFYDIFKWLGKLESFRIFFYCKLIKVSVVFTTKNCACFVTDDANVIIIVPKGRDNAIIPTSPRGGGEDWEICCALRGEDPFLPHAITEP